jgi:hypothetical protein
MKRSRVRQCAREGRAAVAKNIEQDKIVEEIEREYGLDGDDRSIWEVIDDVMRHVSDEALNRLPADGAEQHDHYLYASPKKVPRTS